MLVAVFAVIGHWTHAQNLDLTGLIDTGWTFMAGLGLAWLLTVAWENPLSPLRTGTGVWAATVLFGMVLRAATGAGTAGPFILVASGFLFATLVGWRIIASAVAGKSGTSRR